MPYVGAERLLGGSTGVEVLSDLLQTQPHPAFYRPERQVQKVGYLHVGVPREVRQLQHLELLRRQTLQGLPDLGSLGVAPGLDESLAWLRGRSCCLGSDLVLRRLAAERS
jgi:hypothetical protein